MTDPFHDFDVECIGIPDGLPEKSIVRKVKKSITISRPAAFPDDEPWDVHICSLPERKRQGDLTGSTGQYSSSGTLNQYGVLSSNTDSLDLGPITIVYTKPGYASYPSGNPYAPGQNYMHAVDFNDYLSGQSRVIASAFEVHDVSAELYQQGTCTVYRLPQFNYGSTLVDGSNVSTAVISRMPPGDLEAAMLLPGSRQWEAKWGCYCVDTFDLEENRPQACQYSNRAFILGDLDGSIKAQSLPAVFTRRLAAGSPGITYCKPTPRDTSGAMFTGLSPNSTLTLTMIMIVETFPTYVDSLVTLARSTPDLDPTFFALYKAIAQEIPAGVMVGENASGDFWDKILGIVSDVAPTLGIAFGPMGKGIGAGIGTAAKVAQNYRNKPTRDVSNYTNLNGEPSKNGPSQKVSSGTQTLSKNAKKKLKKAEFLKKNE